MIDLEARIRMSLFGRIELATLDDDVADTLFNLARTNQIDPGRVSRYLVAVVRTDIVEAVAGHLRIAF